jgi:gluconolactonase
MKRLHAIGLLCIGSLCLAPAGEFEIRNEAAFAKVVDPGARLEKLATDMKFLEGPVWVPRDGGYLVFSDIPENELKRWSAGKGLGTFRKPSGNANGNLLDAQGRLVTCEHTGRRLSVAEGEAPAATLVDSFQGKRFNSPNDVAIKADGTVWFTDPDYGLGGNPREMEGNYVYCFDPKTKAITAVVKDFDKPNGICFSPDGSKLYVADSGKPHHIRVFQVNQDNTLSDGKVFVTIDPGGPDGIRCDAEGRIWSSARDGVHVFLASGELIGKVLVPETPANLCFGGADGRTLFITARKSLYSIPVKVTGAK